MNTGKYVLIPALALAIFAASAGTAHALPKWLEKVLCPGGVDGDIWGGCYASDKEPVSRDEIARVHDAYDKGKIKNVEDARRVIATPRQLPDTPRSRVPPDWPREKVREQR